MTAVTLSELCDLLTFIYICVFIYNNLYIYINVGVLSFYFHFRFTCSETETVPSLSLVNPKSLFHVGLLTFPKFFPLFFISFCFRQISPNVVEQVSHGCVCFGFVKKEKKTTQFNLCRKVRLLQKKCTTVITICLSSKNWSSKNIVIVLYYLALKWVNKVLVIYTATVLDLKNLNATSCKIVVTAQRKYFTSMK